jgi:hypothetical protein
MEPNKSLSTGMVSMHEAVVETYIGWKITCGSINFSQRDREDVLHFIGNEHAWPEKTDEMRY